LDPLKVDGLAGYTLEGTLHQELFPLSKSLTKTTIFFHYNLLKKSNSLEMIINFYDDFDLLQNHVSLNSSIEILNYNQSSFSNLN